MLIWLKFQACDLLQLRDLSFFLVLGFVLVSGAIVSHPLHRIPGTRDFAEVPRLGMSSSLSMEHVPVYSHVAIGGTGWVHYLTLGDEWSNRGGKL